MRRTSLRGGSRRGVSARRKVAGALVVSGVLYSVAGTQAAAQSPGEWWAYGSDLASSKYAPLDQIDRSNFARLGVVWSWESADATLGLTLPDGSIWRAPAEIVFEALNQIDPERWRRGRAPNLGNLKATPLMVGETLFLNTPNSIGAAIDARTGETRWTYDPRSYEEGTPATTYNGNQRGVAYWQDGDDARVLWGTGNGYLVCVAARSGLPCDGFGEYGRVDLMQGMPRVDRNERDWEGAMLLSVQSPPIVVRDVVVTPVSVSSQRIPYHTMPPGWMRGFDVRTGELIWTFHTIPESGEFGVETWEDESWRGSGKVGVWTTLSADEELGIVYLPLSTAGPDYYGGHRPGNNLFAESLVALDAETGERVWHFQTVHHGLWDYDLPASPNLVDVVVARRPVAAVAQITKQGFVFVFDRATGEPVWPIEEHAVETDTNIEGERPSLTQPVPTRPAPFEYQGSSIDDLVDFTPEIRRMAIDAVEGFRLGPLYTPHSLEGTVVRPGSTGGGNWGGAAFDPETGLLYVPSRSTSGVTGLSETDPESGSDSNASVRYRQSAGGGPRMPEGLPLWKPPYSRLTAIDLNTGEHAWMVPTGDGNRVRSHPLLEDLDLPPVGGDVGYAGPLLTRTLLVYPLTAGGTDDGPRLVAYDKATGEELASVDLPGRALGTPMSYMLNGIQYIALTVSGDRLPALVALALPEARPED